MDNKPLGCEHFLEEVLHVGIVLNDEYRLVAHVNPPNNRYTSNETIATIACFVKEFIKIARTGPSPRPR
jgi:hypothetical protein